MANTYICTGNKPFAPESRCETITAASARDAYLAFTKHGYVDNVSIIAIDKDSKANEGDN